MTEINQHLHDHDIGVNLLHKEQMHLEMNLKMLMTKMGVTLSNTLPSDERDAAMLDARHEKKPDVQVNTVDREHDPDFDLTANEFHKVLDDCSRVRPDAITPPPK